MNFELSNGNVIWYEQKGNITSPHPLVFLNGLSQSTAAWSAIAPAFYDRHPVILIDLVDQGQSGSSVDYKSYDAHAADVAELLAALTSSPAILIGISYGSAVAQHLLVNHPQHCSGALLLSTFAHNTPLFDAIGDSWKAALLCGGYPLMLDVMLPVVLGKTYFNKPLIPIATLKESRVASDLRPDRLLRLMQATEHRGDYRERLKNVRVPVSVVQGEEDILIPPAIAKEVADHIEDAQFTIIEKAGHTLNLEAIPQTIAALREFIVRIETKRDQQMA